MNAVAENRWNGIVLPATNGGSTMALTGCCEQCGASFFTVSLKTRFCSTRCKNAYWREEYKRLALVDALLWYFEIPARMKALVLRAVRSAWATFCRYAKYLKLHYFPKRRVWELVK